MLVAALAASLASGVCVQLADRLLIDSRPAVWRMMRRVVLRRLANVASCLALRCWWFAVCEYHATLCLELVVQPTGCLLIQRRSPPCVC